MSTAQVNYLNIGLMIVSAIAAFILPFELFLFSYAVLGPLHYLTEISWLHKRQYFSPKKRDYIPLVIITLLIAIPAIFSYLYSNLGPTDMQGNLILTPGLKNFFGFLYNENPATALIFMGFAFALVMVLIKDTISRIVSFVIIFIIILSIPFATCISGLVMKVFLEIDLQDLYSQGYRDGILDKPGDKEL